LNVYEVPVRMPKMSMTMTEGEILTWNAEPGATLSAGDVVCEVMTDKVDMEVEAPVSGTLLRIDIEDGVVAVGTPIAWIASDQPDPLGDLFDDDAAGPAGQPAAEPGEVATDPGAQPEAPTPTPGPVEAPVTAVVAGPTAAVPRAAVPRARALARASGIDLDTVAGTGPGLRVLVEDVERLLAPDSSHAPQPTSGVPQPTSSVPPPARAATATASPPPAVAPTATSSPRARAVRAATARAMTASAAVPQFTMWRDLELEAADVARHGISWTTLLLRGYAGALRTVPALLGRWNGTEVVQAPQVTVALAVDTPDGLFVPVFADPDRTPVELLDADVKATSANARTGKVDPAHLLPAAATLSNLGGLGIDGFQALVTPPQASALAVGSISRRPVAVPGGLGLGLRVTVGLSVDHRVADGADGARLLDALAAAFTEPLRLLGPSGGPG
jgi:pyruvate dehydrogenase E2 component (dihydrolipoamide acetyltransferase)